MNLLFQTRYLKLIRPPLQGLKVSDAFNLHSKANGIAADYRRLCVIAKKDDISNKFKILTRPWLTAC